MTDRVPAAAPEAPAGGQDFRRSVPLPVKMLGVVVAGLLAYAGSYLAVGAITADSAEVATEVTFVEGRVSFGSPVVGADVTVTDPDGQEVLAAATTDDIGGFAVPIEGPPDFRVEVSGGVTDDGTLTPIALAARADSPGVDVHLASTIVDAYLTEHPEATLRDVQFRLVAYLGLDPDDEGEPGTGTPTAEQEPLEFGPDLHDHPGFHLDTFFGGGSVDERIADTVAAMADEQVASYPPPAENLPKLPSDHRCYDDDGSRRVQCPGVDLSGYDLTWPIFYNADLREADLSGSVVINIAGADLSGANLRGVKLISHSRNDFWGHERTFRASLENTNFTGADLTGVDMLTGHRLSNTNFTDADLTDTSFEQSVVSVKRLRGANLSGANFQRAEITGTDLTGFDMTGPDLRGVTFDKGADLAGRDLAGIDLSSADLTGADLSGADLAGAKLSYTRLENADLTGANLTGAKLEHTYLYRADLTGADLTGADLTGADLGRATLVDAVLAEATTGRVGQYGQFTTLFHTDLTGADLTGVDLDPWMTCETAMPDGSRDGRTARDCYWRPEFVAETLSWDYHIWSGRHDEPTPDSR